MTERRLEHDGFFRQGVKPVQHSIPKRSVPPSLGTVVLPVLASLWCKAAPASDTFEPIELGRVKIGGEIGRRIDVTANNSLLVIDVEKDFLQPFAVTNN